MEQTRRNFIKTTAAAAGGLSMATGTVVANGVRENQFLVDTRSTSSDAWREQVEIIDEADAVQFASVKGDESDLEGFGLDFAPEVELSIEPPGIDGVSADDVSGHTPDTIDFEATDISEGEIPSPHPYQWSKRSQNVESAHEAGATGDGVTIAIVDSGIDASHPDLDVDTDRSGNFSLDDSIGTSDDSSHGTHCAGIAAATGNRASEGGPYVVGVAPEATLLDMKVFPFKSSASILSAVTTAVDNGATAINLSLGPGSPVGPSISQHLSVKSYRRIGSYARENGALLVESAGNADTNIDEFESQITNTGKGSHPGWLSVSATGPFSEASSISDPPTDADKDGIPDYGTILPEHTPSDYTNYGPKSIDVSAPGGNASSRGSLFDGVMSTLSPKVSGYGFVRVGPGGGRDIYYDSSGIYGTLHGTSMAAPQVTGLVAVIMAENPNAHPDQVKAHIKDTAKHIDATYPEAEYFTDEPTDEDDYEDGELDDLYDSRTFRGAGHIDIGHAATKAVAFPGGIEVNGETYYPTDPDDDGRYEDVNGDGTVDMKDVELLYEIALQDAVNSEALAFDFNEDGRFDMKDAQALLRKVE
ncbi:subtilisin-like serine proteinase [Haloferax mucosum ATCC BAA-1512]|uniref:Subtilisin-like serine proteinase n=1 Tax=Haloferax mucosum ATCC BAA-1512 TaxID=662479 RepID=M0IJY9_9EURY|nr:S8 family serine peptidase [Haloferax mucosum]ELZ97045.1 subtilisin-like serine proteinase [Haloferax mucosum ATCC BAA-1512]